MFCVLKHVSSPGGGGRLVVAAPSERFIQISFILTGSCLAPSLLLDNKTLENSARLHSICVMSFTVLVTACTAAAVDPA